MYLNNLSKRPLRGNHVVFLEDDDISNLDVSGGVMPFGKALERRDIFCRPPLPEVTNETLTVVPMAQQR